MFESWLNATSTEEALGILLLGCIFLGLASAEQMKPYEYVAGYIGAGAMLMIGGGMLFYTNGYFGGELPPLLRLLLQGEVSDGRSLIELLQSVLVERVALLMVIAGALKLCSELVKWVRATTRADYWYKVRGGSFWAPSGLHAIDLYLERKASFKARMRYIGLAQEILVLGTIGLGLAAFLLGFNGYCLIGLTVLYGFIVGRRFLLQATQIQSQIESAGSVNAFAEQVSRKEEQRAGVFARTWDFKRVPSEFLRHWS